MHPAPSVDLERAAWLALFPALATLLYHVLPARLQENLWVTFSPQLIGYLSLAMWAGLNTDRGRRLRITGRNFASALRGGALVGTALGVLNGSIILGVVPALGGDILFLQETPHGRAPVWVMLPLGIALIGILVEVNFRGFQLGRLLTFFGDSSTGRAAAVLLSAIVFAWDPFMVQIFRHLHWLALWDGVVWGVLLLRTGSLAATMTAHTVEVWIVYAWLKLWFL